MPWVLEGRDCAEHAVRGERVLGEVVGTDRGEVRHREDPVGEKRRRGHLHHDAGGADAELPRHRGEVAGLVYRRDHRGHHPQVGVGRRVGLGEGGELVAEDLLARAEGAEATQPERRVLLVVVVEEAERFVGAGVECADDDLLPREGGEQTGVLLGLLGDAGRLRGVEEEELGAEQAHTLGSQLDRVLCTVGRAEVREQRHGVAVGQRARYDGGREHLRALGDRGFRCTDLGVGGVHRHDAGRGVEDDQLAVAQIESTRGADDGGDRLLAGEDRRVRGRATVARDQAEDLVEVEQSGVGRGEIAGDEHERLLRLRDARRRNAAQVGDHPL
ncbi:hypothetical protein ACH61_01100 [Rathayibacter tanaceti]|uniref:Uncharacterized protein n=1 Tax=Rathayibacter tanaceti TaxID=1671680 RepID=A0A162FZ63_9MICO|nr:hypothetical protein ACH61_01100 [Rathayibacter tanaceti]